MFPAKLSVQLPCKCCLSATGSYDRTHRVFDVTLFQCSPDLHVYVPVKGIQV